MNLYKDRLNTCYWCGQPATGNEHVPPQNLFPREHRRDLLTVGACKDHNENFSKLDERLRFLLAISCTTQIAREHLHGITMRGLQRPESLKLAQDLASNYIPEYHGKTYQRESASILATYFEKIIRGLYFYHYGVNLDGSTSYFSNKIQLMHMSADAHFYYYSIANEFHNLWLKGSSKNLDVFDYKYYYSETEHRFFVSMTFYKEHEIIGVTIPPNKTIDDYGLNHEEYLERRKHWLHKG